MHSVGRVFTQRVSQRLTRRLLSTRSTREERTVGYARGWLLGVSVTGALGYFTHKRIMTKKERTQSEKYGEIMRLYDNAVIALERYPEYNQMTLGERKRAISRECLKRFEDLLGPNGTGNWKRC